MASLMIMVGHYIFVYQGIEGGYGGLPKLTEPVFTDATRILTMGMYDFSYGLFGVAIFFLVSGFVIPFSLEKFNQYRFGFMGFIVARVFRLWPVYIVGFFISMLARWYSFHGSGIVDGYTFTDLLANLSLFRDWTGHIPLDGVNWTLEVEIKFYLLSALFAGVTLAGRPYLAMFAGVAALIGFEYGAQLPVGWVPPANFLFAAKYILFMTIGTNFYMMHKGRISATRGVILSAISLYVFVYVSTPGDKYSYAFALCVFSMFYLARDSFKTNKVLGFFADISYPLYAMHAAFGYVGIRILMDLGLPSYVALVAQMVITVSVAYLIHRFVENPSQRLGRDLSMRVLSRLEKKDSAVTA